MQGVFLSHVLGLLADQDIGQARVGILHEPWVGHEPRIESQGAHSRKRTSTTAQQDPLLVR